MIEISVWKIFLVLLVAFLVLGPNHLPQTARRLGRLLKEFRGILNTVQKEIQDISVEQKKEDPDKVKDQL